MTPKDGNIPDFNISQIDICPFRGTKAAYRIAKLLDNDVPVLKKNQSLPASGVVIVTLVMAKGLEFDHVVIPDADATTYPDTPLARRQLYTAVSRAMHQVTLLSCGEMSSLLS